MTVFLRPLPDFIVTPSLLGFFHGGKEDQNTPAARLLLAHRGGYLVVKLEEIDEKG